MDSPVDLGIVEHEVGAALATEPEPEPQPQPEPPPPPGGAPKHGRVRLRTAISASHGLGLRVKQLTEPIDAVPSKPIPRPPKVGGGLMRVSSVEIQDVLQTVRSKERTAAQRLNPGLNMQDVLFNRLEGIPHRRRSGWCKSFGLANTAVDDSAERRRVGVGDWWSMLLTCESLHPSDEDLSDHTCKACAYGVRREHGVNHTCLHHAALNELAKKIEPDLTENADQLSAKEMEAAAQRLAARDVMGATVLHAAILGYGAERARDTRLSARALALARYLISFYGPAEMTWNNRRLGISIDLVNRSCFADGGKYNGESALHMAIVHQDEELVKLLLASGADLGSRAYGEFFKPSGHAYYGELPLSFAISCGNLRICYLLVDHVRNAPGRLLRTRFDEWDINQDGKISSSELKEGLKRFRDSCHTSYGDNEEVLARMTARAMQQIDTDGDGLICFKNFADWVHGEETEHDNILMQQDRVYRLLIQTDGMGNTALHMAVLHKRIDIFDWLLERSTLIGCNEPPRAEIVGDADSGIPPLFEGRIQQYREWEQTERLNTMKELEAIYADRFDADHNGVTTTDELMHGIVKLYTEKCGPAPRHDPRKYVRHAQAAVRQIDSDQNGIVDRGEWKRWWWGAWWSAELIGRTNSSALCPLTLAALAGDEIMFEHVLEATQIPKWSYGPVACHEMPLLQLDTLRIFDIAKLQVIDGTAAEKPQSTQPQNTIRWPHRKGEPLCPSALDEVGKRYESFKRSVLLIVLIEDVEAIADNPVLTSIQDIKWDKYGRHYFWLAFLLYFTYVVFVWILTFQYAEYQRLHDEQRSLGSDSVSMPMPIPDRLWRWEYVVFVMTCVQGALVGVDWYAVYQARLVQERTIKDARAHIDRHIERAYRKTKQFGPYFFKGPTFSADTTKREQDDEYERQLVEYWETRLIRSPGSTDQCFLIRKPRELGAKMANFFSKVCCSNKVWGLPEVETEERKYVGPADFTQRMSFELSFYQQCTLLRTVMISFHFVQLIAFDDGSNNWFAKMSLAVSAPITHIQFFEFSCGHRKNGHLMIVIARALGHDIGVFSIVLLVYIFGFSQALYVLNVDFDGGGGVTEQQDVASTDSAADTVARIFRGWLALFRIATGEKPGWSKMDTPNESVRDIKSTVEQLYIYAVFVSFVILVFIVLLRLLISMFNETYAGVKKSRERIWRLQRGLFLLTAERRLLMLCKIQHRVFKSVPSFRFRWGGGSGGKVRATLGQRLLCRMWLGEVDEVSTRSYEDDSGAIRLMRKQELKAIADECSTDETQSLRKEEWLAKNDLSRYDATDWESEEWTIQPALHSMAFQGESIEAALGAGSAEKPPAFAVRATSEIRTKELAIRNTTRLKNMVNAKRQG